MVLMVVVVVVDRVTSGLRRVLGKKKEPIAPL